MISDPAYNTVLSSSGHGPFHGRCVLITGASRGIGKRLALGFAAAGARVGLLARTQGALNAAQLEIEQAGGQALPIRGDVREPKEMESAAGRMISSFGGLDVLIAAAGVQGPVGPFLESRLLQWRDTFDTNLLGVMNCCKAVMPGMIARRSGKIVALIGNGTSSGRPNFAPYAAAGAAVARFVESIAGEVHEHNVQINCFHPGGAYTSMTDEILQAGDRAGAQEVEEAQQTRMTGGIAAERQIQFALFLGSERSNHITGKAIHVRDDLKKLEHDNMRPESFTLRRLSKG